MMKNGCHSNGERCWVVAVADDGCGKLESFSDVCRKNALPGEYYRAKKFEKIRLHGEVPFLFRVLLRSHVWTFQLNFNVESVMKALIILRMEFQLRWRKIEIIVQLTRPCFVISKHEAEKQLIELLVTFDTGEKWGALMPIFNTAILLDIELRNLRWRINRMAKGCSEEGSWGIPWAHFEIFLYYS